MKNLLRLCSQVISSIFMLLAPLLAGEVQSHEKQPGKDYHRLHAAKDEGKVCELPDGDVLALRDDPETQSLVAEVNARRLKKYEAIAQERGIPIEVVRQAAAVKIAERHPERDYRCH